MFGELDSNMFDDVFKFVSIGFEKVFDMSGNFNFIEVSELNIFGVFLVVGLIVVWCCKNKWF